MDSPRGRIVLMRIGHEKGRHGLTEMTTHFDQVWGAWPA